MIIVSAADRRHFGSNAKSTNFLFFVAGTTTIYEGTKSLVTRYLAQIKRNFLLACALSCDEITLRLDNYVFRSAVFFSFSLPKLVHGNNRYFSFYGSFA